MTLIGEDLSSAGDIPDPDVPGLADRRTRPAAPVPTASRVPSGLNAAQSGKLLAGPRPLYAGVVARSQSRMSKSAEPDATCRLSELNAAERIHSLCGGSAWSRRPVAGSQVIRLRSPEAESTCRPSGLNATPVTHPRWSRKVIG